MSTEVTTLQTANFADMAKAMGMAADAGSTATKSTLPRLRISNQAVMGQVEVKGKMKNMEVVPGGTFRLETGKDTFIYAESVKIRAFVQRFMYKRYDSKDRFYIKTVMAEDLNSDLKDNKGMFNCGRPGGYIEDWNALSKDAQDLIKSVKRVRVIMGEVTLLNVLDADGNELGDQTHPFIWEVENKDAFKEMGQPFNTLMRQKRLPVQHYINVGVGEPNVMANGAEYFLPVAVLDQSESIDLTQEDQDTFANFMEWIGNYNSYIVEQFNEERKGLMDEEDKDLLEEFIDVSDVVEEE